MYRDTAPVVDRERSYEASVAAPSPQTEPESITQLSDELLMAEALSVNAIMTAARFHRDEAETISADAQRQTDEAQREGREFQAGLHSRQFQACVAKLGGLGIAESDIPAASLKWSHSQGADREAAPLAA